jgi:phage/plasmid primase-like uncharacterized protein
MPTSETRLLDYLRHETQLLDHEHDSGPAAAASSRIRVPLEVAGSIWCAEVEQVDGQLLRLVVDQRAVRPFSDAIEGIISFQSEHGQRHRASGRLTQRTAVADDKVQLNFELS